MFWMPRKEYYKKYSLEHKKEIVNKNRNYYQRLKREAYFVLGNKCCRCGFPDHRALQIDHINGGGLKDDLMRHHQTHYRAVINSMKLQEGRYQLLCANCNWIKRWENNEHRK